MERNRTYAVKIVHHVWQAVCNVVLRVIVVEIVIQRIIAYYGKIFRNISLFAGVEIRHCHRVVVKLVKIGVKLS